MVAYIIYGALRMPWPGQGVAAGAAIVGAGLYAFAPLKRACQAQVPRYLS
jgi:predicted metal-binding membrane protein